MRHVEELKAVDSPPLHGPTTASMPAENTVIYVGNAINLDTSNSTSGYNGSANVVYRITSSRWNLTGTFTGSFNGETASFTPKNAEGSIITLAVTASKTGILGTSPHDDIILFVNAYIAYWSQGMSSPPMGFNHKDEISYNDMITLIDSCVAYWNGQQ